MLSSDPLSPLFPRLSPFLLHFYLALPHRLALPLCRPAYLQWEARTFISSLGLLTQSFRTRWGGFS